jgi:ABC-type uncharacterized transport system permease subunit
MHNLFSAENIDKAVLIIAWFVYISSCFGAIIMKGGADAGSSGLTSLARAADAGLFGSRVLQQFMS